MNRAGTVPFAVVHPQPISKINQKNTKGGTLSSKIPPFSFKILTQQGAADDAGVVAKLRDADLGFECRLAPVHLRGDVRIQGVNE